MDEVNVKFSLESFAKNNNCDILLLHRWAKENGFKIAKRRIMSLKKNTYQRLLQCLKNGIKNEFTKKMPKPIEKPKEPVSKPIPLPPPLIKDSIIAALIEWKFVYFYDYHIKIIVSENSSLPVLMSSNKPKSKNYIKFIYRKFHFQTPHLDSRKSFNAIKKIYEFRNAPRLLVEIVNDEISKIINEEVLTYYIRLFQVTYLFDQPENNFAKITIFKGYNKFFYRKHLFEVFSKNQFFDRLCTLSSEKYPIIPVPEHVINSSSQEQIHDSFLFPIMVINSIFLIWESIEELKATYIFKIEIIDFEKSVQHIFNYLAGNTKNKRKNLIVNQNWANELCLVKRLTHSGTFKDWEYSLNNYIK